MKKFDYIQWRESYTTGIDKIDEGHLQFIRIYNQLIDAVQKDICAQKMMDIMYALIYYVEHHLINEEICYQGYENFAVHKQRHQEFIERINSFREYLKTEMDVKACHELLIYLRNWFDEHILKQDKDAVNFVKNN